MILLGTIANSAAIVIGCILGLLLGKILSRRFSNALSKAVALCVIYIGISGMLSGEKTLVTILSMVFGALLGEALRLEDRIQTLGRRLEKTVKKNADPNGTKQNSIAEGFVSASILFCVGAMAIVGAMNSGLQGDHSTLYAKALLDGVTSLIYASTMGIGVAFSAIAVFFYQSAITICASFAAPLLTEVVINEMKCVGSLLILAIGLNMMGLTKLRVMNFIPAMFFPILLCLFL